MREAIILSWNFTVGNHLTGSGINCSAMKDLILGGKYIIFDSGRSRGTRCSVGQGASVLSLEERQQLSLGGFLGVDGTEEKRLVGSMYFNNGIASSEKLGLRQLGERMRGRDDRDRHLGIFL